MSGRARGALAGLALAALGASGAVAQEGGLRAVFEGCVGGLVGSLEAIGAEFPGFRSGEVRLESHGSCAGRRDIPRIREGGLAPTGQRPSP